MERIYMAAIAAVDPGEAVRRHLVREGDILQVKMQDGKTVSYHLSGYKKIIVVGGGKATAPMAAAVEDILGDRISKGSIVVKYGYTRKLSKIKVMEASHPVPDQNGVDGAARIRAMLEGSGEDTLVISLISGGGSALLALPAGDIRLEEKQVVTDLLLKSGASIHEMNAVRKHISGVKGGNLARAACPATILNLMISDVVGDNMDVIASGPFVPDRSTYDAAIEIIKKYSLTGKIPAAVKQHLESGANGDTGETPKEGDTYFERVVNVIAASNIIALRSAAEEADKLGYNTVILSSMIEGDTALTSDWHAAILKETRQSSNPLAPPACIISGGETTVKVTGDGLGGRNMEFALQMGARIQGMENVLVASIGTDGTDGPTDAAGALADGHTFRRANDISITPGEYLERNDSYHFFEALEDLVKTGPTNTNVMDVRIMLAK